MLMYSSLKRKIKNQESENGESEVVISAPAFLELIRVALMTVPVDQEWYLKEYPEVVLMIDEGRFKSAQDHYIALGYFENRLPFAVAVDEAFYLKSNTDVASAHSDGRVKSVAEHFFLTGRHEGRAPYAGFSILSSALKTEESE